MDKKTKSADEKVSKEKKLIMLPEPLWNLLNFDAERCKRSVTKQIEAILAAYFEGDFSDLDRSGVLFAQRKNFYDPNDLAQLKNALKIGAEDSVMEPHGLLAHNNTSDNGMDEEIKNIEKFEEEYNEKVRNGELKKPDVKFEPPTEEEKNNLPSVNLKNGKLIDEEDAAAAVSGKKKKPSRKRGL